MCPPPKKKKELKNRCITERTISIDSLHIRESTLLKISRIFLIQLTPVSTSLFQTCLVAVGCYQHAHKHITTEVFWFSSTAFTWAELFSGQMPESHDNYSLPADNYKILLQWMVLKHPQKKYTQKSTLFSSRYDIHKNLPVNHTQMKETLPVCWETQVTRGRMWKFYSYSNDSGPYDTPIFHRIAS